MPKTVVEKLTSPRPDVSIFKISGTLGYHENSVLTKFFAECAKKNIRNLVMDFSALTSLGGGCAKIIRESAAAGEVAVFIVGASTTVQNFLENKGSTNIVYDESVDAALTKAVSGASEQVTPEPAAKSDASTDSPPADSAPADSAAAQDSGALLKDAVTDIGQETAPKTTSALKQTAKAPALKERAKKPRAAKPKNTKGAASGEKSSSADEKDLQKKLVQYRALFSLNSEFNRIREKSRLLDAFLLSTIAQIGVESAAFLEATDGSFTARAWKGFETADPGSMTIKIEDVVTDDWLEKPQIYTLDEAPLSKEAASALEKWGMPYIAPFVVYGEFRALVLMGRTIRKELDEDSWDFLNLLIKQAAIAYENSCRYEKESERTLGLVHSLISMIEENTISRGNTEMIVGYVHAVATQMHYDEESLHDLIYGTVLRDIGMIKVSDLIVRSPRELQKEEWEIIKRHPLEGAEMLNGMRFSQHVKDIVLCHHERFNGEGYPNCMQGPEIPLGARIVSVVESFVAMLQDRPTRPALTREEALGTLKENWGMRYDPEVIETFVDIVEDEIRSGEQVTYKGSELIRI